MPKPGPKTLERFERVASALSDLGVVRGAMFGMPMLKTGKRVFAGIYGDAMTFKLAPEDLATALAITGVEPFEPMAGRAMKEWVLVPLARSRRWPALAEQARRYVAG